MKNLFPITFFSIVLLFISLQSFAQQAFQFDWVNASPFTNELNPNYSSSAFAVSESGAQFSTMLSGTFYNNGIEFLGPQDIIRRNADGDIDWTINLNDTIYIRQIAALPGEGCILFGDFVGDLELSGFSLPVSEYYIQTFLLALSESGSVDTLLLASSTPGVERATSFRIANGKIYAMVGGYNNGNISRIEIYDLMSFAHLESIVQGNIFLMGDIDVDPSGNVYVTGSCLDQSENTTFNGAAVDGAGVYNKYLVKYNSDHQFEWIRIYDDVSCIQPNVRISPDGNSIYMSDSFNDTFTMGNNVLEGPNWVYDFYVAKLNPQGDVLWAKEVPNFALSDADRGRGDFMIAENDGVAISGFFRNYFTWGQDTLLSMPSFAQTLFVLKLDENGDNEWAKGIQSQDGISYANSLSMADDDYYLNGIIWGDCTFSGDYSFSSNFYQGFTAKLSALPTDVSSLSGNVELSIYPNPTSDFLNIYHGEGLNGLPFGIYSLKGKELYKSVFIASIESVDLQNFPAGIYVLRVLGLTVGAARFVKM